MSEDGFTQLHYAATTGNQEPQRVTRMIQQGISLEARTSLGNTPLHIAAKFGQEKAIKLLIGAGAQVNALNNDKQTPLHLAACYNVDPAVPQELLDGKADKELLDRWNWTPIFWAAYRDYHNTFRILRVAGAFTNLTDEKAKTPLHWAAETGSINVIRQLLEADRLIDLQQRDIYGWTPLFWAAYKNKTPALEQLIDWDAHKNVIDKDGWTALMWAAYVGAGDAVRCLLRRRAKADIKDQSGKAARDIAKGFDIKLQFN